MSLQVFQTPPPRDPFAGATQSVMGGINQLVEQDAINRLLKNIESRKSDPLSAILQSGLGQERQSQLLTAFQNQDKIDLQKAEEQRKLQNEAFINQLTGEAFIQNPGSAAETNPSQLNNLQEPTHLGDQRQNRSLTIRDFPEEKIQALTAHSDPRVRNLANQELSRRGDQRKEFLAEREFASKRTLPFLTEIDKQRDQIRNRDFSGKMMLSAIEDEDLSFWSPDNLANITGFDQLRTAKGQQFITSGKEFFLSNIQRAGSRPNQWIEQQIQSAMANIGTSKEAQLTATKTLIASNDIDRKKVELTDQLSDFYKNQIGFIPENIASLVDQSLKPFVDEIQSNLAFDLRRIYEQEKGQKFLEKNAGKKVSKDTPLTTTMANIFVKRNNGNLEKAIAEAKRLGYTILTPDQLRRYQNSG